MFRDLWGFYSPFYRLKNFLVCVFVFLLNPQGFAEPVNDYNIFQVKDLNSGKNVTVGRFVLAYMHPNEQITVSATESQQNLALRLDWQDGVKNPQDIKMLSEWLEKDQKLLLSAAYSSQAALQTAVQHAGLKKGVKSSLEATADPRPSSLLSLPLKAGKPIKIVPLKYGFGEFSDKLRIVISSDRPFEIGKG